MLQEFQKKAIDFDLFYTTACISWCTSVDFKKKYGSED